MVRQPEQEGERRPYAAAANVVAVINRVRSRNLPPSINNDFLRIAGIGSAVFGRVMQTLQFLRLVDGDGAPTERLRAIAAATEADYRRLLAEAVREAYADDFATVDPEHDSAQQVMDAFRRYEPRSQTDRMVMLFLGLCREAGLQVLEAPRDRHMQAAGGRAAHPRVPRIQSKPVVSGGQSKGTPSATSAAGLLFGFTDDDVSKLSDQEFNEVWAALGKVARARARKAPSPPEGTVDEEVKPD
jgi:hypothetical protein